MTAASPRAYNGSVARWALVIALAAAGGCYRPVAGVACAVRCDSAAGSAACPTGLSCFDGLCRASASDTCTEPTDGAVSDVVPDDGMTDGVSDACYTYGTGLIAYQSCETMTPTLTFPAAYNTASCGDATYRRTGGICFAVAHHIDVFTNVTLSGPLPLILVADTININGTITSMAGTGSGCPVAVDGVGGGGGAGGTAGDIGGAGGAGTGGGAAGANLPTMLASLRGGCSGGAGYHAVPATSTGYGGSGGGVIYLIAPLGITFGNGVHLNAPGAYGEGGAGGGGNGGGAGGSGGLIAIDTNNLTLGVGTVLCAEGGGGGGGGSKTGMSGGGSDGGSGCSSSNGGGAGIGGGGNGGDGSTGTFGNPGFSQAFIDGGGGGGGGAAGYVRGYGQGTVTRLTSGQVTSSPAVSP
jgi:hypothetical protein